MNDADRQNALADVHELAEMLHALRGLEAGVEGLLGEAIRHAHGCGLLQIGNAEQTADTGEGGSLATVGGAGSGVGSQIGRPEIPPSPS